jgi:succinylglutamate desuccinylase
MTVQAQKEALVKAGEHLLAEFSENSGVTLIVFGGVHGNEVGGVRAIKRIVPALEKMRGNLRGRVYFLAGNTRAILRGVRFIDADLNRHWTPANLAKNRLDSAIEPDLNEDVEQRELLKILNEILATAKGEVYALDLHSTSADGAPFATVGDTLRNRHFAQKFPVTILLGIEEQLDGTILEYLNNLGTVTLGFEGGQHFAESTVNTHEALIWLALAGAGILQKEEVENFEKHTRTLATATGNPRLVEVRYRHAITTADEFQMNKGYENFQPVKRGEILATDARGKVTANETGMILMPLYQKLGEDGFFLGREVAPFWLRLSKILRKMNVADLMHLLPGVRRHPEDYGTFLINTRIARFFPLQIFHLLGFRKRRWRDDQLIVSRRAHDTKSPFINN